MSKQPVDYVLSGNNHSQETMNRIYRQAPANPVEREHKPSCKSRIRSVYSLRQPCDCGAANPGERDERLETRELLEEALKALKLLHPKMNEDEPCIVFGIYERIKVFLAKEQSGLARSEREMAERERRIYRLFESIDREDEEVVCGRCGYHGNYFPGFQTHICIPNK